MSRSDRCEEDSWDEEAPRPRRGRSSRLPVVLIVCLVGGGLVLALLVCGGLAFWLFKSISQEVPVAQASAEAFLDHLQQNRFDEAYAQTAPEYQRAMNKEQFKGFVMAFPAFVNHNSRSFTMRGIHLDNRGGRAQFAVTLLGPGPPLACTVNLTKQGGQWQVQHLSVP